VLAETRHPFHLITKNALVERDIDLLAPLAAQRLVTVSLSVTTLDNRLAARMEPRASAPHRRIAAIRALSEAGIPVGLMVAPVIPAVTDHELESILEAGREAGALSADFVLLRLPHELKDLFRDWLQAHLPDRAAHVMSLVRQMRGGRDYDPQFGSRMRGEGEFATLLAQRFRLARRRLGYPGLPVLDETLFRAPRRASAQGELF
jgi:DNA repair photolyase